MQFTMAEADFDNIKDTYLRQMMENAYNAITVTERGWDFMKNFSEESFMYSTNPLVQTISANMVKLGYGEHSGASFGWTMRSMEYLAKHGKEAFFNKFTKSSPE